MSLSKLADVQAYDAARRTNIDLWTPLVWNALARLRGCCHQPDLNKALVEHHFNVLANQALWAVTEVSSGAQWKYAAQRYFSKDVWSRWQSLSADSGSVKMGRLYLDLRHEHVLERRDLVATLRSAGAESDVANVLASAISCVVTVEEDARLRGVTGRHTGWARYANAVPVVEVWDRLDQRWL